MHPAYDVGQLSEYTSHERFVERSVVLVDEVEKLSSRRVFQYETSVFRRVERSIEADEIGMVDVLPLQTEGGV
jgi:hypothetical protein